MTKTGSNEHEFDKICLTMGAEEAIVGCSTIQLLEMTSNKRNMIGDNFLAF